MWRETICKLLLTLTLCLVGSAALAQEITGDIRGIVKDPSGAVVSGATVEVINTDRNVTIRTVRTESDGSYVAPYLPVGHYKIVVKGQGFKDYAGTNITINVNDRRVIDVSLQVGATSEVVNVQAAPTQVDLETPTASGLITGLQVRELSIASRNYEQLVALQPGVSTNLASDQLFVGVSNPTGLSNQINFSINGNRPTQNNWTLDGADNVDRGANLTLLAYPSIEAIEEFNVLRSNYLPEHGRSSSGEITVITRSGTNQFHGSAYEFFRNNVLNGNNFFNNANGLKRPPLRWNDFGFTFGGPLDIPKVYKGHDKTFFFYSQEWRRIITYNTFSSGELPTAAEMAGTMPVPVCTAFHPATNACTATGTQITNIAPTAQAYVKDIYSKLTPNAHIAGSLTPGLNQLFWTGRNIFNYREEAVRIDHIFNSKFSLFGRYLDDSIPTQEPAGLFTGLGLPGVATTSTNSPGRNLAVHGTWTISPTLLADLGYAFSYGAVISRPIGSMATANSPDIKPTLPFGLAPRIPDVGFNDGQGITGFGPYNDYNRNHEWFGNVTKILHTHSLKFGGSFNYYTKDENVNGFGGKNGAYSLSDTDGTGAPAVSDGTFQQEWANFLNGTIANFTQANIDFRALVHQKQLELFVQDEWRPRRNLTLSYGVRYGLFMAPTYGNGLLTTFDPALFNSANALPLDSSGLYTSTPATPYLNGIIIGGKNSPYGAAVARTPKLDFAPRLGVAWDPFGRGKDSIRAGFGIFFDSPAVTTVETFVAGNPPFVNSTSISNTNLETPAAVVADVNLAPATIGGPVPNWKQPYSEMWSLDLQHQITSSLMIDVGYYGNVGRHLLGVVDVNMPKPGAFLSITNPPIPSPVSFANTQRLNLVRPFQGWDAINLFEPAFTSNYNGLQAAIQKQFTKNSLLVFNYTWSHALGTATNDFRAAQNTYNIRGDYGNLDYDRRQIVNISYVYNLPFFKNQSGFTGHVLGGWEVSGILLGQSGSHLTATWNRDPAGLGVRGNSFSGGRPDMVGDPNQDAAHIISHWFNTSAFAPVPAGVIRPGNEARGTIVGPSYYRWDASLFKNFKLNERFNLQFRAESFNVLNHTNFNNPSTSLTSSLFGKITSARDPRNMQLALKLVF